MHKGRLLIIVVLAFFVLESRAQEGKPVRTMDIQAVAVKAERRLSDIGAQKTVMDSAALRESVANSLADVLAFNSALFIKSYGRATLSTVSFRGTAPSHTQVLWNGMKLNSPMLGMVDFSLIPSYFVDEVSLYHGASSVGITGGGLGGAVNLTTRPAPEQGFGLKYIQGISSFSTYDEFLKLSYGGRRWQGSTRVAYASSDNDFSYVNYRKKDYSFDGAGNITGYTFPREKNRNGDFRDLHILQDLYYTGRGGDRWSLSAWYMRSRRGLAMLSVEYNDEDRSRSEQFERTLRAVAGWDRSRAQYRLGVHAGYTYTDMSYTYSGDRGDGTMVDMVNSQNYVNSVFVRAEGEYYIGRKWMFSANVSATQNFVKSVDRTQRISQLRYSIIGYNEARIEASAFASVRYKPTERWGLALNLREELYGDSFTPLIPAFFADYLISRRGQVIVKASVARNYRFPTLNDLYFRPGGNTALKSERGYTYDGGVEFTVKKEGAASLRGELTAFDSYIDNWILWLPSGTYKGVMSPVNIKKVHSYGFEAKGSVSAVLGRGWSLGLNGNYAITHSVNRGEPVNGEDQSAGKQLVYVPVYSAAATGRLSWKKWTLAYKWNYYSQRFTTTSNDMGSMGVVEPYYMNDVSIEKRFDFRFAGLSVKAAVNNLFGEEYVSVLSHPMAGRNYGLLIEITPRFRK